VSRRWTTRDKLIGTLGGLSWVLGGLGTLSMPVRLEQRPAEMR
jgi:hypothetical protein